MWGNSAHYHTTHSKSNLLCMCKWVYKENNCDMKWADTFPGRFTTGADSVWLGTRTCLTRGDDYLDWLKKKTFKMRLKTSADVSQKLLQCKKVTVWQPFRHCCAKHRNREKFDWIKWLDLQFKNNWSNPSILNKAVHIMLYVPWKSKYFHNFPYITSFLFINYSRKAKCLFTTANPLTIRLRTVTLMLRNQAASYQPWNWYLETDSYSILRISQMCCLLPSLWLQIKIALSFPHFTQYGDYRQRKWVNMTKLPTYFMKNLLKHFRPQEWGHKEQLKDHSHKHRVKLTPSVRVSGLWLWITVLKENPNKNMQSLHT